MSKKQHMPDMTSRTMKEPIFGYTPVDIRHRLARRGRKDVSVRGQITLGQQSPQGPPITVPSVVTVNRLGPDLCAMGSCPRCGRTLLIATGGRKRGFKMLCRKDCDGTPRAAA